MECGCVTRYPTARALVLDVGRACRGAEVSCLRRALRASAAGCLSVCLCICTLAVWVVCVFSLLGFGVSSKE